MSTNIKQLYASLEINDRSIKLLVSEFFNTRFNIIKVIDLPMNGVSKFEIIDHDAAFKCINEAIQQMSSALGANLDKVILVLPTYSFQRIPLRVSVNPESGVLKKNDIVRALNNSLKTEIDNNHTVIDSVIIKYTINGISSRRFPENEVCDSALLDIDLLLADKTMTYSFVSLVEECGVEVVDVCLNSYAIAKEAALLEQALSKNVILLSINDDITFLTLLTKGKIITNEVIYEGFASLSKILMDKYNLPYTTVNRLLKFNVKYEGEYLDDVAYAWKANDKSMSLTSRIITNDLDEALNKYIDKLIEMCTPIFESGETQVVMTGEGADIQVLSKLFEEKSGINVKTYYPDTIGVRECSLSALFGACFTYKEKVSLQDGNVDCVDIYQYNSVVDRRKIDVEGETITTRIKNFFQQYKNREDDE